MKAVDNALLAGNFQINLLMHSIKLIKKREGTTWLVDIMSRLQKGNADFAEIDMIEVIKQALLKKNFSKYLFQL